ncbi:hypothetical protein MYA_5762 [Burkholderia sp. KJ006]|nr:hypothetical protein MYA_5762 [Burkholderia sp. KJ006]
MTAPRPWRTVTRTDYPGQLIGLLRYAMPCVTDMAGVGVTANDG